MDRHSRWFSLGRGFLLVLAFLAAGSAFSSDSDQPFNPQADALTLYFFPSPLGLDWSSPAKIAGSALWNSVEAAVTGWPHSIGHVDIRVSCPSVGREVLTGMTGAPNSEVLQVLFTDQLGIGMLFHTFSGNLIPAETIEADLHDRYQDGKLKILKSAISSATCERLLTYYDQYSERGYGQYYGLSNQPRLGQGAGCSAFGESFMELAGLIPTPLDSSNEYTSQWSITVRVPDSVIGDTSRGIKVEPWGLIFGWNHTPWAQEDVAGQDLTFWSPDQMVNWAAERWKNPGNPDGGYQRFLEGNAQGLYIDRTNVPTPTDPIWLN